MNRIKGTDGADTLRGAETNDQIRGLGGDDNIQDLLGGDDTLLGEAGDDFLRIVRASDALDSIRIEGGSGADTIEMSAHDTSGLIKGDGGGDTINIDDAADVTVSGGTGGDSIKFATTLGSARVSLGDGDDILQYGANLNGQNKIDLKVTDFETGAGGDVFDMTAYIDGSTDWSQEGDSSPFTDGYARLVHRGDNTSLQIDFNGGGNHWTTIAVFKGTDPIEFTSENFAGYDPVAPTADMVI